MKLYITTALVIICCFSCNKQEPIHQNEIITAECPRCVSIEYFGGAWEVDSFIFAMGAQWDNSTKSTSIKFSNYQEDLPISGENKQKLIKLLFDFYKIENLEQYEINSRGSVKNSESYMIRAYDTSNRGHRSFQIPKTSSSATRWIKKLKGFHEIYSSRISSTLTSK